MGLDSCLFCEKERERDEVKTVCGALVILDHVSACQSSCAIKISCLLCPVIWCNGKFNQSWRAELELCIRRMSEKLTNFLFSTSRAVRGKCPCSSVFPVYSFQLALLSPWLPLLCILCNSCKKGCIILGKALQRSLERLVFTSAMKKGGCLNSTFFRISVTPQ